jgi:hypothetical protein
MTASLRRILPVAVVAAMLATAAPAVAAPPPAAAAHVGAPNRVALVDRPNAEAFRRLP